MFIRSFLAYHEWPIDEIVYREQIVDRRHVAVSQAEYDRREVVLVVLHVLTNEHEVRSELFLLGAADCAVLGVRIEREFAKLALLHFDVEIAANLLVPKVLRPFDLVVVDHEQHLALAADVFDGRTYATGHIADLAGDRSGSRQEVR